LNVPTKNVSWGAAVARALALELAVRLVVRAAAFEGGQLRRRQHHALLRALRLERPEAVLKRRQVVPLPPTAHSRL